MKRSYSPDPRPRKRVVDVATLSIARHRKVPCRICGKRAESIHHIVARSLGGDDVLPNLVSVCGHGTAGCHGLLEAHDRAATSKLRSSLTDAELAYVLEKKGDVWLERYLPATQERDQFAC